jgi:hypothetical protein
MENNRLTEEVVELSLINARNSEAFSNDRNALMCQMQDLRQQLRAEQAERVRCTSLLAATQEALQATHAMSSVRGVSSDSVDQIDRPHSGVLLTSSRALHDLEAEQGALAENLAGPHAEGANVLTGELSKRTMECEALQEVVAQQTLKANATILELAKRNLELERRLQEVTARSLRGTSLEHDGAFSRASSPARSGRWQLNPPLSLPRKSGCVGLRQRRSASGPPKLNHSSHEQLASWDPAVTLELSGPSRSRRRSPHTSGLLATSATELASPNLPVGGDTRSPFRRLCAPRGASVVGDQQCAASVSNSARLVHVRKESRHKREGVPDWLFQGVDEIDEADAAAAAADAARARSGSRTSSPRSFKQRGNVRRSFSSACLGRVRC